MDFGIVMKNMQEISAKRTLRGTEWGASLDDVMTAFEKLLETANETQLTQLSRMGGEITRIADQRLTNLDEDDDDDDDDDDE